MSSPPVAFPRPPPTSNTRSSYERAALVRSSKKLSKVLGDVPHVLDGADTESTCKWGKRKPTHLPPLLRASPSPSLPPSPPDSPSLTTYHHRGSVLSIAPSIISNAPSTASGSSCSDASDPAQRRTKLEHLRRKLGDEVPATAVFPPTAVFTSTAFFPAAVPRTPKTATSTSTSKRSPRGRTRSIARFPAHVQPDDTRSLAFSISSDESVHRVTLSAARVRAHSPRPPRQKHVYQTGPLPPVPPIPTHLSCSSPSCSRDDDAGLVRPRLKMAAGSKIGGSDFKAARRAKREGKANGVAEPWELIEMVGFLR